MSPTTPPVTKPGTRHASKSAMEELAVIQKRRRVAIKKMRKTRQATLIQLSEEGNVQADEILRYQDNPERQTRCQDEPICHGCLMLRSKGRCGGCIGCTTLKNCIEDKRRCAGWKDVSKPFTQGSSISATSSLFTDIADGGAKMEALFVTIEEASESQEELLENIPVSEDREIARHDPIFGEARVKKDLEIEQYFLGRIRNIMIAHQENMERQKDADEALKDMEGENGRVTEEGGDGAEERLPGDRAVLASGVVNPEICLSGSTATSVIRRRAAFDSDVQPTVARSEPPMTGAGRSVARGAPGPAVASSLPEIGNFPPPGNIMFHQQPSQRRNTAAGNEFARPPARQAVAGFVPFTGRDLVADERAVENKKEVIDYALTNLEELMASRGEAWALAQLDYTEQELRNIEKKMENLTDVEMELSRALELYRSLGAATGRSEMFRPWKQGMQLRCSRARRSLFDLRGSTAPSRSQGAGEQHLERVQLPIFTGNIADYPDFRGQFRELAQGYAPIIALAQLKNKLHPEGRGVIDGGTGAGGGMETIGRMLW